jgi:hypothetical protein
MSAIVKMKVVNKQRLIVLTAKGEKDFSSMVSLYFYTSSSLVDKDPEMGAESAMELPDDGDTRLGDCDLLGRRGPEFPTLKNSFGASLPWNHEPAGGHNVPEPKFCVPSEHLLLSRNFP